MYLSIIYIYMYMCICVCMYIYMYICVYICIYNRQTQVWTVHSRTLVRMYIRIYVCMYTHTHTHTHKTNSTHTRGGAYIYTHRQAGRQTDRHKAEIQTDAEVCRRMQTYADVC